MPRQRYTISNMPLRGGLMTAGQQGTIAEDQLWQSKNCSTTLDGMLWKRPGLWQWGQTLKYPAYTDSLSFYEMFSSLDLWTQADNTVLVTHTAKGNKLKITVAERTAGALTDIIGRGLGADGGDSDSHDFSLRFTARFANLQDESAFIVSARAQVGDSPYAFQITATAVQYYATGGTWTDLYVLSQDGLPATSYEFRVDVDGNATLYVDDTLVATQAVSTMDTYSAFTVGTHLEIFTTAPASMSFQYSIYIMDLMMDASLAAPFTAKRLQSGTDFKTIIGSSGVERNLLVANDKILYRDKSLKHEWSPLLQIVGGEVAFSQFGDELLIFDAGSAESADVYRWDGIGDPEILDDAPPVRFGSEHRSRIFAAGDKRFPLRVYFTASRQPNVWFAPEDDADGQEQFNEVTEAGYLIMPGKRGDEVVAIYGEFYGSCIIMTNRGIWRVTGSSPLSYNVENVSQDVGAASASGVERLANDLWFVGRQGIGTIQTVQQFGDIKTAMPSGPIADLWNPGLAHTETKIDQYQLFKSSMAWNPTTAHMLFAFARQGASDVSTIYAYSAATQAWAGPWDSDTTFVESVEVASPVVQTVMHGTSIGKVGVSDVNWKMDFDGQYVVTIESPYLTGRSLDPSFTAQTKTWKVLRLFLHNVGDWDFTVKWQVDDENWQEITENVNIFDLPKMGEDWRLDVDPDGRIHSNQLIGMLEIPIDIRGRSLKFQIITDDSDDANDGEDFILQGYQVEFLANGPDQEQE